MRTMTKTCWCWAMMSAALFAQQPLAPAPSGSESQGYELARRGIATVEDAYRQFLSLAANQERIKLDAKVRDMSFEDVVLKLNELCIIDSRWSYRPGDCLRRDLLAYMCTTYLGCKPGLFTGLCGVTRRYAHREMLYRGVLARGSPNSYVSGAELLAVVSRVAQLTETRPEPTLSEDEIH
jgi:hypothetical protein